jgi:hypothetical protein
LTGKITLRLGKLPMVASLWLPHLRPKAKETLSCAVRRDSRPHAPSQSPLQSGRRSNPQGTHGLRSGCCRGCPRPPNPPRSRSRSPRQSGHDGHRPDPSTEIDSFADASTPGGPETAAFARLGTAPAIRCCRDSVKPQEPVHMKPGQRPRIQSAQESLRQSGCRFVPVHSLPAGEQRGEEKTRIFVSCADINDAPLAALAALWHFHECHNESRSGAFTNST